ncbi:hypothetical protein EC988_002924 [Linderina pennispora]|nr:hypothetical protein EC988_002924 [Linderina pennispora]
MDEDEEENDIAQSILATWRLGVMDIRRVHFMDDVDTSDVELENNQLADWTGDDWPSAHTSASRLTEPDRPLVLISDDDEPEAIEDNSRSWR